MSVGAGDLINNLRMLLTTVEAEAFNQGYTLPDRRYVTLGGAVYDVEQVVVSAMSSATGLVASTGDGLSRFTACPPVWNVSYEIAIVRCAVEANTGPRGTILPTPGQVEADAIEMSKALAVLTGALDAVSANNTLGEISASVTFGQPQGGLIAAVASLQANLWAPEP